MSKEKNAPAIPVSGGQATRADGASWGPKLFWISLILILVFFWWVLIYSGGVTPHHG